MAFFPGAASLDLLDILWAEDEAGDRLLIKEALAESLSHNDVRFVPDGQEALDALRGQRPRLLVLDLNMPRLSGLEVLRAVRADPATHDVPVVVFSSGKVPKDVEECEALGVAAYVQKPLEAGDFFRMVHAIVATVAPPQVSARHALEVTAGENGRSRARRRQP